MRLDWALLAEAAQLREGLAFVLGGGIDTVAATQMPARLDAAIVVRLLLHRSETDSPHVIEVRVVDEDGGQLAAMHGHFRATPTPSHPKGWDVPLMAVFGLHGLNLPRNGLYSVEVLADGVHQRTLNFQLVATPA
jgi:hypothetical protein